MYKSYFEWLDFWNGFYYKAKVKPDTYKNSRFYIIILKKQTEDIALKEIDEFYCQTILNNMFDHGYAKGTIKKIATILRQSLLKAKRLKHIQDNPSEELIIPQAPTKRVRALTHEEQKLIEIACNKEPLGYLIIFMLNTGLRRSELINLKWADYNKEKKEIHISNSKTKSGIREIPLINITSKIIEEQTPSYMDDYIFHGNMGRKLSNSIMKKLYERIRVVTNITTFTNHVCRHTFATRLIEMKASPKSVSTLLGHAKVEYALNIYTDLEKAHIMQEIYLLEKSIV